MSIKLFETGSPDVIEVAGRGELQLAVLIESMRREGYELQVSRPEVITKEVNGKRFEPQERGVCDVPDEHVGTVTQELAPRKGRITDLRAGDAGRTIVTFECPSRGLIGFRSLLMTATRGTALLHQHHMGWMPWAGDMPDSRGGAMVSDRVGQTTGYALDKLQLSGQFFVNPGEQVYEGMVVGECARDDEMVVNAVRAEGEEQHPHAQPRRRRQAADPEDPHAGDRDRVDRRRRARRGHPEGDPHPQAPPRPRGAPQGQQEGQRLAPRLPAQARSGRRMRTARSGADRNDRRASAALDGGVGERRPLRALEQLTIWSYGSWPTISMISSRRYR